MVFVDRAPTELTADCVIEDDLGGAHMAMTHLIDHGHRRIAFIGDAHRAPTTMQRLEGYTDDACGCRHPGGRGPGLPRRHHVPGDRPRARRIRRPARSTVGGLLVERPVHPGIYPSLQRLGGEGLAMVSFGDFPMAASLQPSVTVIDQDPLGRRHVRRRAALPPDRRAGQAAEASDGAVRVLDRTGLLLGARRPWEPGRRSPPAGQVRPVKRRGRGGRRRVRARSRSARPR